MLATELTIFADKICVDEETVRLRAHASASRSLISHPLLPLSLQNALHSHGLRIRMPKKLNYFEAGIRNLLKQYISRGKVDVFLTYEDMSKTATELKQELLMEDRFETFAHTVAQLNRAIQKIKS